MALGGHAPPPQVVTQRAHAAEVKIALGDQTNGLGLRFVDGELAIADVVGQVEKTHNAGSIFGIGRLHFVSTPETSCR